MDPTGRWRTSDVCWSGGVEKRKGCMGEMSLGIDDSFDWNGMPDHVADVNPNVSWYCDVIDYRDGLGLSCSV